MKSLILLPALLLTGQASAREGAIDLGVGAGATFMDPLEVMGTSPSFSPRVGYWYNDTLLFEADIGFTMGETSVGTPDPFPFLSLTPRANVVGRVWPDEPISLLFVAGLGAWYKSINDGGELDLPQGDGSDLDLLANAGPGLMIPLGDTLAFRSDLRWMMSLGTENWENRGDAFMNWEVTGGIALMIGGTKDTDKDGIADDVDQCIDDAEDLDSWEDEDGCPDLDNDGDGIADVDDVDCPNDAEDMDEFNDEDGCPDLDNDEDGVADADDACPMVTGVESGEGCPDEDGDGVKDDEDECTRDAANADVGNAFGCPDGDGDMVPDYRDSCPEEAGPEGASPFRSNGCNTRVFPSEDGIVVSEPVEFTGSRGSWKQSSNLLVDDISEVIKGVKSLTKLEIRVYAEGEDDAAMKTAQIRADKLKETIVKDGADEARLTAKGVAAPKTEGEGPHPNVFVAATDKQEITGLKRKYEDDGPEQEKKGTRGSDAEQEKSGGERTPKKEEGAEEPEQKKTGGERTPKEEAPAEEAEKADEPEQKKTGGERTPAKEGEKAEDKKEE